MLHKGQIWEKKYALVAIPRENVKKKKIGCLKLPVWWGIQAKLIAVAFGD